MPQITVNTGMNTKPVLNGIKDMNSAIRSLRSVVSQAGKDMDVAVVGYAKAMRNNAAASREATTRVQELDAAYANLMHELEAMAMTKYMTPEFAEFTDELHKQEELLARLNSARKKDTAAINETEEEIRNLKTALQELKDEGKAFVLGSETEEFQRLQKQANDTVAAANKLREQADEKLAPLHIQEWNQMATATGAVANGLARVVYAGQMLGHAILHPFQTLNRLIPMVLSGLGSLAKKAWDAAVSFAKMAASKVISFIRRLGAAALTAAKNLVRMAGTAVVSGLKNIGSLAAKAGKAILGIGKNAKRGNTSLKQAVTMLIRYGFGVRSIFMLVRRLRTALVDAFKNMAQAVPEVNNVMSNLSASLGQLKNSMATAFQPILTAVAPLLNTFMEMMTDAMTKVGMFFAALTGQDYVYKAQKANVDLAKSLDKTKKSANEAENQLAGFDHLNILKAPNDSGTGTDTNAADGGGFQKTPLLESIKNFANTLKDMLLNGEFAELGKVLANKVNGLFNSIDLYGIAQKLGGLINNVVAFYNAFMEGVDWQNIGKKFADGINGLLDSVNWTELGRALSQKINAIWGIIAGLVDNVEWDKLGKSLSDAVWGWFGNIKWNLIGETIGKGINGISNAIINFANTFPWKEAGQKIADGLNALFDTANLQSVVDAFLGLLNGALDSMLTVVSEFEWGENGEKFRLAVLDLITNFPADKLAHLLSISIKGILDMIAPTISDPKFWRGLGERLGTFMNNLFGDREMWKGIGETANNALNGILTFGQSFLDTFKADEAADNIKTALGEIKFDEIATNTWELMKKAFKKAGDFLNVLFADESNSHYDPWKKMYIPDPGTSLGERVGKKLREALSNIPWGSVLEELKTAASTAFKGIEDFLIGILGVDKNAINDAGGNKIKAIALKLGAVLESAAKELGTYLGSLPWSDIFEAAWKTIKTVVSSFIDGLLGDSSGNGQVLLWVGLGIIALKAGILPLIGKLVMGLASGFAAGGPIMAAGLTAALSAVAVAGIVKLTAITVELVDAQREMNEAFGNETESGLSNYVYLWKTYGKEAAEVYARKTYGFQTTNESLLENTKKFGEHIAEIQGTTYDRVNTIVSEALGTYKSIFKTKGAEAANEWAQSALYIQTTGANLSENLAYLAEEIEYQATTSTEVGDTIHNACESVKIDVLDASEQTERLISTATDNIESKTSEAAPNIEDNLTTPYSNAVPQVESDMQAIYDAADNGLEQDVKNIEAHMSEASKTYGEKTNEIVNTTETAWGDMSSTQSKALQGMTGNTESGMSQMTSDVATGTTDQRQPVYDNWDMIATFMQLTLENMKTDVRDAMTSMYSAVYSGMNDIVIVASYGMQSLADSVANGASNVVSAINNVDWEDVGSNIVYGIRDGMLDNWKWLQNTAKNLANNLLQSTKNALGIASPSRLFRDEVGVMLGLGIAEGVEDSQPAILGSVSDVADAMTKKMNDTDMAFNVGTDAALDSFGDKIANSFTTLLDRLQTIADRVTFQTPTIATGTVLPYNVAAQTASAQDGLVEALTASNDDMASVVIQATNNAALAIVQAIQKYSNNGGNGTDSLATQTSKIIDEINRRARMQGTSPIIV